MVYSTPNFCLHNLNPLCFESNKKCRVLSKRRDDWIDLANYFSTNRVGGIAKALRRGCEGYAKCVTLLLGVSTFCNHAAQFFEPDVMDGFEDWRTRDKKTRPASLNEFIVKSQNYRNSRKTPLVYDSFRGFFPLNKSGNSQPVQYDSCENYCTFNWFPYRLLWLRQRFLPSENTTKNEVE